MKTIDELNADILKITMKIKEIFPELSKYIEEMPTKNIGADNNTINIKELKQYNDSLHQLLKKYSAEHIVKNISNSEKQ